MLVTRQKALRRFWYALMPIDHLRDGPKPFTLMGERHRAVETGRRHAGRGARPLLPPHRPAVQRHGRERQHRLRLPRLDLRLHRAPAYAFRSTPTCRFPPGACRPYRGEAKYGYVWVALEDPLKPIPHFPEDGAPGYRRIFQFYEEWKTSPLRMMENSFDNSHFSYVHKANFGIMENPKPAPYTFTETDYGFEAETHRADQQSAGEPPRDRHHRADHRAASDQPLLPAVCRRFGCTYPASGVAHHLQLRDTDRRRTHDAGAVAVPQRHEERCSTQKLIDWDAAITEGGPRHPRGHRCRRLRGHATPRRVPHALGQARPGDTQAAAGAAACAGRNRDPFLGSAGMLVTKQKTLRRFWYPVMPVAMLRDGPKPFTLLGERWCCGSTATAGPRRCATAAVIAPPSSPRDSATAAISSAAITAGPTTDRESACAFRSRPRRRFPATRASTPSTPRRATATCGSRSTIR